MSDLAQRHVNLFVIQSMFSDSSGPGHFSYNNDSVDYWGGGGTGYLNPSGAGRWVEFDLGCLMAGTWRCATYSGEGGDRGIITLSMNGVVVGGRDFYRAGAYVALAPMVPMQFVLAESGPYTARFTCTGKNAAASNYWWDVNHICFDRISA